MQVHYNARVVLLSVHHFFVVRFTQEGKSHTVCAQRGLDDIGDIVLVCLRVKVFQAFAAGLLMAAKVVVGAVCNAPQFAPIGEREGIFNVCGGVGIKRQLCGLVVAQAQVLFLNAKAEQPVFAIVFPIGKPLKVCSGLAEELALHLLKLARAEREVARRDFVAERLAHLANAKGKLAARGALHIGKVYKNALRGFGAQITGAGRIFRYANGCFEHQIEFADGGKIVLAAHGAHHIVMLGNKGVHLVKVHGIHIHFRVHVANQLVCPVAGLAAFAVQQGIRKAGHMAGGHPGLRVHQNGGVQPHVVRALLHKLLPPGALYVVFKLYAKGAVIPRVRQAAVNFTARINKASVFAQGYHFFHFLFVAFHACHLFLSRYVLLYGGTAVASSILLDARLFFAYNKQYAQGFVCPARTAAAPRPPQRDTWQPEARHARW